MTESRYCSGIRCPKCEHLLALRVILWIPTEEEEE